MNLYLLCLRSLRTGTLWKLCCVWLTYSKCPPVSTAPSITSTDWSKTDTQSLMPLDPLFFFYHYNYYCYYLLQLKAPQLPLLTAVIAFYALVRDDKRIGVNDSTAMLSRGLSRRGFTTGTLQNGNHWNA